MKRAAHFENPRSCLFLKIYTSPETEDALLNEVVFPVVDSSRRSEAFESFFFIRYADPQRHLRLRFLGNRKQIRQEVRGKLLPEIGSAIARVSSSMRIQEARYNPEKKRYGGLAGVRIAERLFDASSWNVLGFLGTRKSNPKLSKVEYAVASGECMLDALGLTQSERAFAVSGNSRPASAEEIARIKGTFGAEFAGAVGEIFAGAKANPLSYWGGRNPELERISREMHQKISELRPALRDLSRQAGIALPRLASSYYHMHLNRLSIRSNDEMLIRACRRVG